MAQPQAMTPVRPKQAFRFLNLPMEIRAMILSKLLIPENIIYDCDYDESGNRSTMFVPDILSFILSLTRGQTSVCKRRLHLY